MQDGARNDQRVMEIVSMAMRRPPEERESHIRAACDADQQLYRETLEAVQWEERMGSFLQHPPIEIGESSRPFEIGQPISQRFEIIQEIGEGGMGVVYVAFDRKRNQRIAIKSAKPGFHRLLSPELEGALKVRHPNVCLVNEIHTTQTSHGEIDFLTMELLDGETLSARLARDGKLRQAQALEIACQLSAGLSEAHRSDVLHRDFKSANIILCSNPDGLRAVITDFGLASGIGAAGEIGGSLRYMAPELWRGESPSKASDIFALGVVLYEMVAGRPPFEGRADASMTAPAAPSTLTPGLESRWDRLILKCLSPVAADRPADASLVLAALRKKPLRKTPLLVITLLMLATLAIPQVRGWLRDRIWPPADVRLAILPIQGLDDTTAAARGVLQDVSDRVGRLRSGKRNVVVVPSSEVSSNQIQTSAQAREVLHATHALLASVHREGEELIVKCSVIDLDTRVEVRNFSGRYSRETVGTMPAAIAGSISLALRLQGAPPQEALSSAATVPYDRGLYLLHRDDESFEEAIAQFQEAGRLDPRSPLPLAARAEAEIEKFQVTNDHGPLEEAQRSLSSAESLSPDSARVRLIAGLVNQTTGRYEKALQEYRRAQDLDPRNVDTLLHIASVYNALDSNNEAVATYRQAIELQPGYYQPYRKLGEYYYYHSRYPEAVEQLQRAIERAPGLFDAYNELGGILSILGRDEEAERALVASIRLRETADARNNLGALRAYQRRDKEAVELFQRALTLDPQQYVYWVNLGDASRRLGRDGNAALAYRKGLILTLALLKGDPRDGYIRALVAYFFARLNDGARAEQEISQAMQLSPSDTQVIRRAVLTFEALGEREHAIEAAREAPLTLLREFERQPDLADFLQDSRFKQVVARNSNGGK